MNRRQFLNSAACASAAVFVPSNAPGVEAIPRRPRLRLSTSSIQFKDLPIEQACARIAALGYEAIDIWCAYENCAHLDDAAKRLGADGLVALLGQHHLKLCSFSTYLGGYAKYAALLGKAGGGLAIQGSAAPCPPQELTRKMKAFLDGLKPLIDLAEKHNSFLSIENHGQALLDTLDSFKAFADLNVSPKLGIALAPYHLQASNASVTDAIQICGRNLFFFYAWQHQTGLGQLPGRGPADFKPWLEALSKIGYGGYVNPFMHGHQEADSMSAGLAEARKYLIQLAPA